MNQGAHFSNTTHKKSQLTPTIHQKGIVQEMQSSTTNRKQLAKLLDFFVEGAVYVFNMKITRRLLHKAIHYTSSVKSIHPSTCSLLLC